MIAELKEKSNRKLLTKYYCNRCDTEFCLIDNDIVCPGCHNEDLKKMVIVYMDYDPTIDEMTTKKDWIAGD